MVAKLGHCRVELLFAYVGTQIGREGGLEPQLEEVYARFISDRSALVAVHTDNPFG